MLKSLRSLADVSQVSEWELELVRLFAPLRSSWARHSAQVVTRLGNGVLYFLTALASCIAQQQVVPRSLVASCIALGALHLVYPAVKAYTARLRPCDRDLSLRSAARTLDEYSFPSGHMMSLSAMLTPWGLAMPSAIPLAAGLMLLMGWSRLATGHHYLSDILAGSAFGAAAAYFSVDILARI